MPKILITGNGFDLSVGLPTSYIDFIKMLEHIQQTDNVSFESIYSLSDNYLFIKDKFNSFEINHNMINGLKEDLDNNEWFDFFKNELKIETWIDFENKIEYVLNNIFSSIEYLEDKIFSDGSLSKNKLRYSDALFSSNFEIIEVLSCFKLIDFHDGTKKNIGLNREYLTEKYGYFVNINLEKISKHLLTQLTNFKKIFNSYFELLIFPLYENHKNPEQNLFKKINEHYTFNYTPTFEKMFNSNFTKYLHGIAGSTDDKIILGINDIPKDKEHYKKYFLPFTKYFQKLNNSEYTFIKGLNENSSSDKYIFFFIGHSLDESDKSYINNVFDFISNSIGSIKKIIVAYHNDNARSKLILNLLNIRGKVNIQELTEEGSLIFLPIGSEELKEYLEKDIHENIRFDIY